MAEAAVIQALGTAYGYVTTGLVALKYLKSICDSEETIEMIYEKKPTGVLFTAKKDNWWQRFIHKRFEKYDIDVGEDDKPIQLDSFQEIEVIDENPNQEFPKLISTRFAERQSSSITQKEVIAYLAHMSENYYQSGIKTTTKILERKRKVLFLPSMEIGPEFVTVITLKLTYTKN